MEICIRVADIGTRCVLYFKVPMNAQQMYRVELTTDDVDFAGAVVVVDLAGQRGSQ